MLVLSSSLPRSLTSLRRPLLSPDSCAACIAAEAVLGESSGAKLVQYAPPEKLEQVVRAAQRMLGEEGPAPTHLQGGSLADVALEKLTDDAVALAAKLEPIDAGAKRAHTSGDDNDEEDLYGDVGPASKRVKGTLLSPAFLTFSHCFLAHASRRRSFQPSDELLSTNT